MSRTLRDVADIHYGRSPREVLDADGTVPVVGTGGLYGHANQSLFTGPAIVVPRKGTLGNPQYMEGGFWPVDTTYAVLPKRGVDARWLCYSLNLFDLTKLNEATGVPSISRDWLQKVPVSGADSAQQQRIAHILSTVDEAILQTEALIAKTQRIKAGLMHDLFTRGVTPDGQLRPPRKEAPKLYKDSPLGWIPKEWTSMRLGKLSPRLAGRLIVQPHQYFAQEGVPIVFGTNIREDGIDTTGLKRINYQADARFASHRVREGDLLTVRVGVPGMTAVVPHDLDGCHFASTMLIRKTQLANSHWLCYCMNSHVIRQQIATANYGSVQTQFNVADARLFHVAVPDPEEQLHMVERLQAMDSASRSEELVLGKLGSLRRGLMHDLLTGRVRVPADAPKVAAHV